MAILHINDTNFEQEVLQSKEPVLVDFWADWCGPCRSLAPVLDELSQEQSKVKIAKINVEEERTLAAQYRVMSIPTLLLFKDGALADKKIGLQSKQELQEWIEA